MTATLPRKDYYDIAPTAFLRPQRPDDHDEFRTFLPWMTPLFVYWMDGEDWVRWSLPKEIGKKMGLADAGCACCGDLTTLESEEDYQVDTAWNETRWWLKENGYALPASPTNNGPTKEGTSS